MGTSTCAILCWLPRCISKSWISNRAPWAILEIMKRKECQGKMRGIMQPRVLLEQRRMGLEHVCLNLKPMFFPPLLLEWKCHSSTQCLPLVGPPSLGEMQQTTRSSEKEHVYSKSQTGSCNGPVVRIWRDVEVYTPDQGSHNSESGQVAWRLRYLYPTLKFLASSPGSRT